LPFLKQYELHEHAIPVEVSPYYDLAQTKHALTKYLSIYDTTKEHINLKIGEWYQNNLGTDIESLRKKRHV